MLLTAALGDYLFGTVTGMTWKTRRYLMSFTAFVFLIMTGSQIQNVSDGESNALTWISLIAAFIAGVAGLLAVNQYADKEVAEAQKASGAGPTAAGSAPASN